LLLVPAACNIIIDRFASVLSRPDPGKQSLKVESEGEIALMGRVNVVLKIGGRNTNPIRVETVREYPHWEIVAQVVDEQGSTKNPQA